MQWTRRNVSLSRVPRKIEVRWKLPSGEQSINLQSRSYDYILANWFFRRSMRIELFVRVRCNHAAPSLLKQFVSSSVVVILYKSFKCTPPNERPCRTIGLIHGSLSRLLCIRQLRGTYNLIFFLSIERCVVGTTPIVDMAAAESVAYDRPHRTTRQLRCSMPPTSSRNGKKISSSKSACRMIYLGQIILGARASLLLCHSRVCTSM